MQCACVTLAQEVQGTPEPALHIPRWPFIRANIQCDHRKVVCLSKQETSEGTRWLQWKRGQNPTTRQTDRQTNRQTDRQTASQPVSYIGTQPQ